jgi:FkbM family methyltransferase
MPSLAGRLARHVVRQAATSPGSRRLLNNYYETLSSDQKERFYLRYGKLFRDYRGTIGAGEWLVRFADFKIRLPIRTEWAWLDWDHSLSMLGHDSEVKRTYANLLASNQRPDLFLDIGANYGIHSLPFLIAGIPAILFEPNETCRPHFEAACSLNSVSGRWEPVAIANRAGRVDFAFPERETWLGSISPTAVAELSGRGPLTTRSVEVKRLDDFLSELPPGRIVIEGARRTIEERRPMIVFESRKPALRQSLRNLFDAHAYAIHALPWHPKDASVPLRENFDRSRDVNFIAIPR